MKRLLLSVLVAVTFISLSVEASRNQRRENHQQARIRQGVASGDLTKREAKKLRKGQKRIDKMQVKANSDGVITPEEKMRIEKAQDAQNRLIYKQKHDQQQRADQVGNSTQAPTNQAPTSQDPVPVPADASGN